MPITIRFAKEDDIPSILRLLTQVNRVHYEGRPDLFELTTKYTKEELKGILEDKRTPVFVGTDQDGQILGHGFCVFQRPENKKLFKDVLTLYIDDICVDESARGQQVGRAIYEHIIAFAKESGCYNVLLNVWSCNPGAMSFYEKLGLRPYKVGMEKIL